MLCSICALIYLASLPVIGIVKPPKASIISLNPLKSTIAYLSILIPKLLSIVFTVSFAPP